MKTRNWVWPIACCVSLGFFWINAGFCAGPIHPKLAYYELKAKVKAAEKQAEIHKAVASEYASVAWKKRMNEENRDSGTFFEETKSTPDLQKSQWHIEQAYQLYQEAAAGRAQLAEHTFCKANPVNWLGKNRISKHKEAEIDDRFNVQALAPWIAKNEKKVPVVPASVVGSSASSGAADAAPSGIGQ